MSAARVAINRLRQIFDRPLVARASGEPLPEVDEEIDNQTKATLAAYHFARTFERSVDLLPVAEVKLDDTARLAIRMLREDHPEWFEGF